jgi:hypothetical protein
MTGAGKWMGEPHNRFGEMAEHLAASGITRRFNEMGYHFESILPGGRRILDENGKTRAEAGLLLGNDDSIIAVEAAKPYFLHSWQYARKTVQ